MNNSYLSPFRYPGGKTWLIPYVRRWISSLGYKPSLFVEPFAGGGSVSLMVIDEDLASRVLMVELDRGVAAVWHTVLDIRNNSWLANKIVRFHLTRRNVIEELDQRRISTRNIAFQTILRNRTSRGGIMAEGAGLLREGENSKGLRSRWYPQTLKDRIETLVNFQDRVSFVEGDGLNILAQRTRNRHTCFFIDPPYTEDEKQAGKRLYDHSEIDHERLFGIASRLQGPFLMTYADSSQTRALAHDYGFRFRRIPMTNTHHAVVPELLISIDLTWFRGALH
jgi:DNA adenine methylase